MFFISSLLHYIVILKKTGIIVYSREVYCWFHSLYKEGLGMVEKFFCEIVLHKVEQYCFFVQSSLMTDDIYSVAETRVSSILHCSLYQYKLVSSQIS